MSHKILPLKCPKCHATRRFIGPNGYWCEGCKFMTYAAIEPLSYDEGGQG